MSLKGEKIGMIILPKLRTFAFSIAMFLVFVHIMGLSKGLAVFVVVFCAGFELFLVRKWRAYSARYNAPQGEL